MSEPVIIRAKNGCTATLYCGDCLTILPTLGKVDAVITDPPYGIGVSVRGQWGSPNAAAIGKYDKSDWDSQPASPKHIAACIGAGCSAIIWGGNYFGLPPASKWLVWDKKNSGDFADAELAWTNLPGAVRIFQHMWNGMLRASERGTQRVHPTQKPIALMAWCLQQASVQPSQTILDPYGGSGSTIVAALRAGCNAIYIEIEPKYFTIARRRIEAEAKQAKLFAEPTAPQEQRSLL